MQSPPKLQMGYRVRPLYVTLACEEWTTTCSKASVPRSDMFNLAEYVKHRGKGSEVAWQASPPSLRPRWQNFKNSWWRLHERYWIPNIVLENRYKHTKMRVLQGLELVYRRHTLDKFGSNWLRNTKGYWIFNFLGTQQAPFSSKQHNPKLRES